MAFTSPPFWDLEVYNAENENQSIMGFNNKESWVKGFINKLADINIGYLKKGGHLVIYVPDYDSFMEYMAKRKDVKRKADIQYYNKGAEGNNKRTILVWEKM